MTGDALARDRLVRLVQNPGLVDALVALYRRTRDVVPPAVADALVGLDLACRARAGLVPSAVGRQLGYQLSEYRTQLVDGAAGGIATALALRPGLRILDVGCGGGQTLTALRHAQPRLAVGVDLQPSALSLFAAMRAVLADPALAAVRGLGGRLPFRDASFDRVVCRVVLMYVRVPGVLGEIARVSADGALVYLHLTDAWFWLEKLARLQLEHGGVPFALLNGLLLQVTGRQLETRPGRALNWQTVRGTARLLDRAGFDVVAVHPGRRGRFGIRRQPRLVARRRPRSAA